MRKKQSFINYIITILSFLILEGIAFITIVNSNIVAKYKFMEVTSEINSSILSRQSDIFSYFNLKKENSQLVKSNNDLLEIIYGETYIDNDDKDTITHTIGDYSFSFIPAAVISNSLDKRYNFIILNKGKNDGVEVEMGVITENGVIGYVQSVSNNFCKVASFINLNTNIGGVLTKTNTYGTIRWDGKEINKATMDNIPLHINFSPGDTVATSGFSFVYPPNIPIGKIVSFNIKDGTNYKLAIELFEDFKSIKYVHIVKNYHKEELEQLKGIDQ